MEKTKKIILLVEDDKDYLWLLREGFKSPDLSIIYATNGEDGLAMAEQEKPDLIISDIILPRIDGIAMAKKIKEKGIDTPIIFLTNLSDSEHIVEAIKNISAADYIIKSETHIDQIVARAREKLGMK